MDEDIDIATAVRDARPETSTPSLDARASAREMLDDHISVRKPVRVRRRRRWVVGVVAAAVAIAAIAAVVIGDSDRPSSPLKKSSIAAPNIEKVVEIKRLPKGDVTIKFLDVDENSAEAINQALRGALLPIHVNLLPASPTLVGVVGATQRYNLLGVVGGGPDVIQMAGSELRGPFANGPYTSHVDRLVVEDVPKLLDDSDGQHNGSGYEIWVGRHARPGEQYVMRRDSAERRGEAIGCSTIYNDRAADAAQILAQRKVKVIWQTSDVWNEHELLMRATGRAPEVRVPNDGTPSSLDQQYADWYVWYSKPISDGVVAVRIGPHAQQFPKAEPVTAMRGTRGVALPETTDKNGFVTGPRSIGFVTGFVERADHDRYPEAGCGPGTKMKSYAMHIGDGFFAF